MDPDNQLLNERKHIEGDETIILTETVRIKGKERNLIATIKGLIISLKSKEASDIDLQLDWEDIISVKNASGNSESGVYIMHYIHHGTKNILQVRTLQIEGNSQQWTNAVKHQIKVSQRPKSLFVIINPIGGGGIGQKIYYETVEPLFKLAEIETSVIVTERSKQALLVGESTDFSQYDGIVVVGGDGLYQELLQGLTLKNLDKSGMLYYSEENFPKLALPIGLIPAGTGNGFSQFVNGSKDVKTAALNIIRGEHHRANIFAVYNNNKFHCVCGFMFAYGIFSYCAKRAEELRWLKKIRYPVLFMELLLQKKRLFQSELHYRLNSEKSSGDEETASSSSGWIRYETVDQRYCCLYAPPSELLDKGDHVLVNPFGHHFQLAVGTNCNIFTIFNGLTAYTMGRKISSKPGSLELIDKVTDFKVKIIRENPDSNGTLSDTDVRNRELEQILSIDGEMVQLETSEFIIRLISGYVPVYSPNLGRVNIKDKKENLQ